MRLMSSVWLMYHTLATDGRWCRWSHGIVFPCIRAYILTRSLSDYLRVDVMTRSGNQTPSDHSANWGGTRTATAMQSLLYYIMFFSRLWLIIQVYDKMIFHLTNNKYNMLHDSTDSTHSVLVKCCLVTEHMYWE